MTMKTKKITVKEKSFFNTLVDILHKDYQISLTKGVFYLFEEKEPNYPITKILIENKLCLCKFDKDTKGKKLFPFFKDGGQNTCCDFIGFYIVDNECFILLINLKSKNISNHVAQLEGGALLAHFIIDTAQRLLGKEKTLVMKQKAFLVTTNKQKVIKQDYYFFRSKKENFFTHIAGKDLDLDYYCI